MDYSVTGSAGDWDSTDGEFVMPANAPAGYYRMAMRGRCTLQGGDRSTVSDFSQWLIWMSKNNTAPRFGGHGTLAPDPDNPVANPTVYNNQFDASSVQYLEPGGFRIPVLQHLV